MFDIPILCALMIVLSYMDTLVNREKQPACLGLSFSGTIQDLGIWKEDALAGWQAWVRFSTSGHLFFYIPKMQKLWDQTSKFDEAP